MNQLTITVGRLCFEFASYEQWAALGESWFRNYGPGTGKSLCVDAKGRLCPTGREFMRARDEGAFPVKVYEKVV